MAKKIAGIGKVIKDGREIVARGVTDTEPAACEQAHEAAQRAELEQIPVEFTHNRRA
jgi:hypothetical protein